MFNNKYQVPCNGNCLCYEKMMEIEKIDKINKNNKKFIKIIVVRFDKPIVVFPHASEDIEYVLKINNEYITKKHFGEDDFRLNKFPYLQIHYEYEPCLDNLIKYYEIGYYKNEDELKKTNNNYEYLNIIWNINTSFVVKTKKIEHINPKYDFKFCPIVKNIKFTKKNMENQLINENYIYMLKEREFIKSGEDIFKIGKTKVGIFQRFFQYPKKSKLLFCFNCQNCDTLESLIIKTLKNKYKQRVDIGREYFEGDYLEILKDLVKCCDI